ncbi:MAG: hypothetical protein JXM71_01390, partial [Spirochaetales bacterium]|nr:hypothetical protein [Spirochaetales bacterium]
MKRIVRLAIMVAVVSSTYAHAQGVRTVIAGTAAMDSGKPDGVSLVMHYNEAIGILYPEDAT